MEHGKARLENEKRWQTIIEDILNQKKDMAISVRWKVVSICYDF